MAGLDHPRSGELVAISKADRWFSYYFWLDDDARARLRAHRRYPPKARLRPGRAVRRSGDHALRSLAVGWRLAKRKLGQRTLLDVISLKDTQLVKGSHGRLTDDPQEGPLVISSRPDLLPEGSVAATEFQGLWCFGTSSVETRQVPRTKRCSASVSGKAERGEDREAGLALAGDQQRVEQRDRRDQRHHREADVARAAPRSRSAARRRARRRARARRSPRPARARSQVRRASGAARKASGQRLAIRAERLLLGDVGQADQVAEEQRRADPERGRERGRRRRARPRHRRSTRQSPMTSGPSGFSLWCQL